MAFIKASEGDIDDVFLKEEDVIDDSLGKSLWTWGYNVTSQIGDNTAIERSSPVQTVAGGNDWKSIYRGGYSYHCAAIKTDGSLWLWGDGKDGELGDNKTTGAVHTMSSPVQTVAGGTDWKQVAVAVDLTAALKTDGTIWCWGYASGGQMGTNSVPGTDVSSPVQSLGTDWSQVACGQSSTSLRGFVGAIKTDGTLWTWGNNTDGQLGDNTVVTKSSPVQIGGNDWKHITGGTHFAAIKTDGTLWSWGLNTSGQCGNHSINNTSSPVQTVAGGTNWSKVHAGRDATTGIKTDGTLWIWGNNTWGQLGDNTTVNKSSPVQTVAGGNDWKLASVGRIGSSVKTDGTLWTWGNGANGSIGDGQKISRSSPVQTLSRGNTWTYTIGQFAAIALRYD